MSPVIQILNDDISRAKLLEAEGKIDKEVADNYIKWSIKYHKESVNKLKSK